MAHKIRHALTGETTIMLDKVEMLKIEKLLGILDQVEGSTVFLGSEEKRWLSNTQDLFNLEGSPGEYTI